MLSLVPGLVAGAPTGGVLLDPQTRFLISVTGGRQFARNIWRRAGEQGRSIGKLPRHPPPPSARLRRVESGGWLAVVLGHSFP